jgi:hypothetical protein
MVDYRALQGDSWKREPLGARLVAAALQGGIAFNAPLKTAILYRDAFPRQVLLRHPFADRQLHEFCLSLGPQHRTRTWAGQQYTKFLLHLAYVDDLSPEVIRYEIRTPYAAISEQFCLHNRAQLMALFDDQALLARWDILNVPQIQSVLADPTFCQQHRRSLVRMAGVEMWLQGLTSRPRLPSPAPPVQRSICLSSYGNTPLSEIGTVIRCLPSVRAFLIYGTCLLLHTTTLQVGRLDETGTHYWLALFEEPSWEAVVRRLTLPEGSLAETREVVYTFVRGLVDVGWIEVQEEPEREDDHGFSTNHCESFSNDTGDADHS